MSKRVYVSADWKENTGNPKSCDKSVVDRIRQWANDNRRNIEIDCTDNVHDSVVDNNTDCRRCDVKDECGRHIKWSSVVIVVIGDNTATKSAGACDGDSCSPYISNLTKKPCKQASKKNITDDLTNACGMSYLEYEIKIAVAKNKKIIVVYNSMNKNQSWIPSWFDTSKVDCFVPFWKDNNHTQDCYQDIKGYLE